MSEASQRLAERRILILAPTGRDAPLTRDVLAEAGIRACVCPDPATLAAQLAEGAGAILLSEEALANEIHVFNLADRLARQPSWSDLPILLLTHAGADSLAVRMAVRKLGNVTLIERPVRVASLRTAAQSALRARQRQLAAREHLHELDHIARALQESEGRLRALLSNAAVGIAELSPDGRFALVNDALCRILGARREELLARPIAGVALADERAGIEGVLAGLFKGFSESYTGERRFTRQDGESIRVKLSITMVRDGVEPRAVAVIEEVTESATRCTSCACGAGG